MSTIKKQLGQKIKEIRKLRGMTQEQLAEIVGIGISNISYIETGKFAPSIENFEKVVKALDVEPYELYEFSSKTTSEMREEIIKKLNSDDELLKMIYKFYKSIK
ncbi:helix-turn-helix transcriptional regulator [bacterium]|nr:helix-turn-helix transcriptional regulator [bacterium]